MGYSPSYAQREKLSIAGKKAWADGKFDKMVQQTISKSETKFLNLIEDVFGIIFESRQFEIDGKYYDAKIKNILVEIDSKWWHSLPEHKENDYLKDRIAKENNYELYRFEVNCEGECRRKLDLYKEKIRELIMKSNIK